MGEELISRTFRVEHPDLVDHTIRAWRQQHPVGIAFGRSSHEGRTTLTTWDTRPAHGDLIVLVGSEEAIREAATYVGPPAEGQLNHDRSVFDVRRIFVSNDAIAGKSIASLNLQEKFNVLITRVQRGDMDLLASGDTVLELGDRILLVAHRDDLPEVFRVFGNSYEALSRINLFSFGARHHPGAAARHGHLRLARRLLLQPGVRRRTAHRSLTARSAAPHRPHRLDATLRGQPHAAPARPHLPAGGHRHPLRADLLPDAAD